MIGGNRDSRKETNDNLFLVQFLVRFVQFLAKVVRLAQSSRREDTPPDRTNLVTSMTKAVTVVGASFEAPTKGRQEEQRFLKYERKLKSLSGLARRFRFI
jgi:hypothetical protein